MAWDRYCDRISCAGAGYCSGCCRHADLLCYGAVGAGFASGNSLEGLPDAALEGGCANVQGERWMSILSLDQASEICFPLGQSCVVTAAHGERELAHQSLLQFLVGIGELDGADALVGSGNQHAT